LIFKPVSKAEKVRKHVPGSSTKNTNKLTFESPENDFGENIVFAIPSTRKKPCPKSSNCQEFHHKIDAKSDLETSSKKH
jgi:hypothetical protein